MSDERVEELRAQIIEASAHTPSPGLEHHEISMTEYDEGIVEYFRGTSWKGHSARNLRDQEAALRFFTDPAFRYWCPAFMLAELEDPETADVISGGLASGLRCRPMLLKSWSQEEILAAHAFLECCVSRYESCSNRACTTGTIYSSAADTVARYIE